MVVPRVIFANIHAFQSRLLILPLKKWQVLTFKPGKGRVMQIFLTDKGRRLLDEKIYPIIKKENEAFLCMTDEECRLMLELYEKYNNALKNKFKEL